MAGPKTALVDDVTELLILWPHLGLALARDAGTPDDERVTGDAGAFALPINADVSSALATLAGEVPTLAMWAADVIAEPRLVRSIEGHLRQMPRLHERMLVTAAISEAAHMAAVLHSCLRAVKLALGLRTVDRRLGQYCPMHDDPLVELIAPGDEGTVRYERLDREGRPVAPVIEWDRHDAATCRNCGASWAPGQYLMLGRLMREADARRLAADLPLFKLDDGEGAA